MIEQNTCYRMQWGTSWRCVGIKSKADEETGELASYFFFTFLCFSAFIFVYGAKNSVNENKNIHISLTEYRSLGYYNTV